MFRRCGVLFLVFFLSFPSVFLAAQPKSVSPRDFSISPSGEWVELPVPLQNVVVSYGKKNTLATFHVTERELDENKTVDQLRWEDLFSPEFDSIDIRVQNMATLGGQKAKFCMYTIKPGKFKDMMEGKIFSKYLNYVTIHNGKLFSVTFRDTEDSFPMNYPSFLAAIRTFRFEKPEPAGTAGKV
ncbi:MAG TPA: hypothetical protein PKV84_02350 [Candidatus Omnitrophota bacterium]|nr:hypothetical protein [Candidatus Omnitrophota bacterium]